jgi:hypothetical protein
VAAFDGHHERRAGGGQIPGPGLLFAKGIDNLRVDGCVDSQGA